MCECSRSPRSRIILPQQERKTEHRAGSNAQYPECIDVRERRGLALRKTVKSVVRLQPWLMHSASRESFRKRRSRPLKGRIAKAGMTSEHYLVKLCAPRQYRGHG